MRKDYITWDEYFMGIALMSAERSKDPNSQVGGCIVGDDKRIISIGYNGMPNSINDADVPWEREGDFVSTKYAYVCHSELNAVLNAKGREMKGATIYVTLFPCNECAKVIIQAGIKRIVYYSDKYDGTEGNIVSKKLFALAGVECVEYKKTGREIKIKL